MYTASKYYSGKEKRKKRKSFDEMLCEIRTDWKQKYRKYTYVYCAFNSSVLLIISLCISYCWPCV